MLTDDAAAAYVATGYSHCPYCKGDDIEGGPVDIDANTAVQEVSCSACGASWTDIYTLSGVREDEPPDVSDNPDVTIEGVTT